MSEPFYSLTPELSIATARGLLRASPLRGYYEFGIYKGYNLWFAEQYSRMLCPQCEEFYGFDSFEGLPANDVCPEWAEGNYAASKEEVESHLIRHGADMSRIYLVKGWFSLEYFQHLKEAWGFPPVGVAVIDSDLYESCVPVLQFLKPLLRANSILLFDDWKAYDNDPAKGEQGAWAEFLGENREIRCSEWFDFGKYGHAVVID